MSGNTRVGLDVARFSPGELICSAPAGVTGAYCPKIRKSGPSILVWLPRAVPAAPPRSFCSQMCTSGSPSGSVAWPVSANGVRIGIVLVAGAVTTGAWLPVGVTL